MTATPAKLIATPATRTATPANITDGPEAMSERRYNDGYTCHTFS